MARASTACRGLGQSQGRPTDRARLCGCDPRSFAHPPIPRYGAYLGLVPRRYQSGEVDYIRSISKCGDRRVRPLLYEAANVMLTRYKGQLKLKDWAFAIAKRSTMRKAQVALARRLATIMHAMLRETGRSSRWPKPAIHKTGGKSSSHAERRPGREQTTAPILLHRSQPTADCDFNQAHTCSIFEPTASRFSAERGVVWSNRS